MKKSVFISLFFHIILISFMVGWSSVFPRWPRKIDVYRVELVRMPAPKKEVTMKESTPKPAPPTPKPVEKKPEVKTKTRAKPKTVTTKPAPKTETPEPQAPETSESSQLKVDTRDFPYSYYLNLLRYRVQENWNPPFQETRKNQKISAIVRFKILRNGKITAVEVENSSERFLFDQAALRAVYAAGPLPPLPDEFSGEDLGVHIEFEAIW
ncbi:MAG: TonB family protein [Calditrichaeota bacterium]|nr:MAG: TonB family protein [Calditrichota bacterium]